MENLYIYVQKENLDNISKYGMKLSEYANKILSISNNEKKGIVAFLSPKDTPLYIDEDYICLRINTKNLNIIIYNSICENTSFFNQFICKFDDYTLGSYEDPVALICSSILPENIFTYNKIIDLPLIVENSKDYYYEKSINYMIENNKFTKFELYQMLLILGEQKKVFDSETTGEKLRIYKDKVSGKKYTKKSSF